MQIFSKEKMLIIGVTFLLVSSAVAVSYHEQVSSFLSTSLLQDSSPVENLQLSPFASTSSESPNSIGFSVTDDSIAPGDQFVITIYIDSTVLVGGWQINQLTYNEEKISVMDVTPGANWDSSFDPGTIENTNGKITNIQSWNTGPHPDGEFTACFLHCIAEKNGSCAFTLDDIHVTDNYFETISVTPNPYILQIGSSENTEVTIGCTLDKVSIKPGESFTIDIYADPSTTVGGWQIHELTFPQQLFELDEITPGSYWNTQFDEGTINNQLGSITSIQAWTTGPYPTENHSICTLTCTAIASGTGMVTMQSVDISDDSFTKLTVNTVPLSITIKQDNEPADAIMGFNPPSIPISVGDEFTIKVYINPSVAIGGWQINQLSFPHHLFEITEISSGDEWQNQFDNGTIDNDNGLITNIQTWTTCCYPNMNHTACKLHCKALNPGKDTITFDSVTINNEDFEDIVVDTQLQTITIGQGGENLPPTVTITNPSENNQISNLTTINGTAADTDGNVILVEYKIDTQPWQTATETNQWGATWDTTTVTNGEHVVYTRAKDNDGLYSSIESVSVIVNNENEEDAEVKMGFSFDDSVLYPGDSFELGVYIDATTKIGGWSIDELSFPANLIHITQVEPGEYWNSSFFDGGVINNDQGTIANIETLSLGSYPDMNHTAFTLHGTVVGNNGSDWLTLQGVEVTNDQYQTLSVITHSQKIIISSHYHNYPIAAFTFQPTHPLVNEEVSFDASISENVEGENVLYSWSFGDGGKNSTENPKTSHVFSQIGTYHVHLTITVNGKHSTFSQEVKVNSIGELSIVAQSVAAVDETVLLNATNIPDSIIHFNWESNGASITDYNQSNPWAYTCFKEVGIFWIKLTVTDENGYSDALFTTIIISHRPRPVFHPTPFAGAIGVDVDQILRWQPSTDPDETDTVSYQVYFCEEQDTYGETLNLLRSPESRIVDHLYQTRFYPGSEFQNGILPVNTMYYWRVVTEDNHGLTHNSSIWWFTTAAEAPLLNITAVAGGTDGVHVSVKNNGESHQTDVSYTLKIIPDEQTELIEPDSLIKQEMITSIPKHQTVTLSTDKIIGYGSFTLHISIEGMDGNVTRSCFVVYDYVSILSD